MRSRMKLGDFLVAYLQRAGVTHIFGLPGDLVLVLADNIARTWKQIIYFNSEAKVEGGARKPAINIELPETDDFSLDDSLEIISDERGVRIAREPEESD